MKYTITALEYGENPDMASVCAVYGQIVYEDPNHAGMPIDEAQSKAEEIAAAGISDEVIEEKWMLLS